MSEMLERVSKAIQEALEKPRYLVKISKVWELWDVQENKLVCVSYIHSYIDDECDRLNEQYVARKAIEALKPFTIRSFKMECVSSIYVNIFEDGIDAILSGDK